MIVVGEKDVNIVEESVIVVGMGIDVVMTVWINEVDEVCAPVLVLVFEVVD